MRRREFMLLLGGAVVGCPLAARAQQPMPVIGWLSVGSPESDSTVRLSPFRRGLDETGHIEGQNVAIEYRWAEGQYDRLPALAADLVRRQLAVIVAASAPAALAAKAATTTIPIVFLLGIDPVEFGVIASLNRPRGNITGTAILSTELSSKRLQLLHELVPAVAVIGLLVNPTDPAATDSEIRHLQDAVRSLGLQLHILPASKSSEIDSAFKTLVELHADALIVSTDPLFTNQRAQIVALAAAILCPRSTCGASSRRPAG